ncbi:hypothetical protein TESG_08112 [Trichophyton tonsurans CBS 112818]|uniref:Uncharacterized protein n=1 Tax=Trichophyton tonsurans (strain CBS 112818) TaxID=647933 RepID=F2SBA4_TRIT1|nr:hypothetical protein TESG_08112 [Trichophyton tonsurans CBS 112818]
MVDLASPDGEEVSLENINLPPGHELSKFRIMQALKGLKNRFLSSLRCIEESLQSGFSSVVAAIEKGFDTLDLPLPPTPPAPLRLPRSLPVRGLCLDLLGAWEVPGKLLNAVVTN